MGHKSVSGSSWRHCSKSHTRHTHTLGGGWELRVGCCRVLMTAVVWHFRNFRNDTKFVMNFESYIIMWKNVVAVAVILIVGWMMDVPIINVWKCNNCYRWKWRRRRRRLWQQYVHVAEEFPSFVLEQQLPAAEMSTAAAAIPPSPPPPSPPSPIVSTPATTPPTTTAAAPAAAAVHSTTAAAIRCCNSLCNNNSSKQRWRWAAARE